MFSQSGVWWSSHPARWSGSWSPPRWCWCSFLCKCRPVKQEIGREQNLHNRDDSVTWRQMAVFGRTDSQRSAAGDTTFQLLSHRWAAAWRDSRCSTRQESSGCFTMRQCDGCSATHCMSSAVLEQQWAPPNLKKWYLILTKWSCKSRWSHDSLFEVARQNSIHLQLLPRHPLWHSVEPTMAQSVRKCIHHLSRLYWAVLGGSRMVLEWVLMVPGWF